MKRIFLFLFLFILSVNAQTLDLYWDLNGDKSADSTYSCSVGDTVTAHLYVSASDSLKILSVIPIYSFEIPVLYGYYTRWSRNESYRNTLTLFSAVFDSTALLDSTGVFNYLSNPDFKRFLISYRDTTDSALATDSSIAKFTFIVGTRAGTQVLHFNYLGNENNNDMTFNTVFINNKKVNYSLRVKDCKIISQ